MASHNVGSSRSPAVASTLHLYVPQLASSRLERLAAEPSLLQLEEEKLCKQLEALAVTNFRLFIETHKNVAGIRQKMFAISDLLDALVALLEPLQENLDGFRRLSCDLATKNDSLTGIWRNFALITDLEDLPRFVRVLLRSDNISSKALDLMTHGEQTVDFLRNQPAYASRLRSCPDGATLLKSVEQQVGRAREEMMAAITARLRSPMQMPVCVQLITNLRRLRPKTSEEEFGALFLLHRGFFVDGQKCAISASLRGSRSDISQGLRAATDIFRTLVFDVGAHHRALFVDVDASPTLSQWLTAQISWFIDLLKDTLGVSGLEDTDALAQWEPRISLTAFGYVYRQVHHASSTFARLRCHFLPLAQPILESYINFYVTKKLSEAAGKFTLAAERWDNSKRSRLAAPKAGDHPAAALASHRPLAVLCNDLLMLLNDLRQFALRPLRDDIASLFRDCLAFCLEGMRRRLDSVTSMQPSELLVREAWKFPEVAAWDASTFSSREETIQLFTSILVKYISQCVSDVFGNKEI